MSEEKEFEAVFPFREIVDDGMSTYEVQHSGLELRDYFAAKAMQGMIANGITIDIDKEYAFQTRAGVCYMIADAMLKERSKKDD